MVYRSIMMIIRHESNPKRELSSSLAVSCLVGVRVLARVRVLVVSDKQSSFYEPIRVWRRLARTRRLNRPYHTASNAGWQGETDFRVNKFWRPLIKAVIPNYSVKCYNWVIISYKTNKYSFSCTSGQAWKITKYSCSKQQKALRSLCFLIQNIPNKTLFALQILASIPFRVNSHC